MEKEIISNRDFIIFGLQPWDISIGSNCKNIALEIARNNRVLYVNRPLDWISKWKNKNDEKVKNRLNSIKHGKNILTEVSKNLTVFNPGIILASVNFLPEGNIYRILNKRNNRRLAREISWAMKKLNFSSPILLIDNDFFNGQYLSGFLKPSFFIYYIRDFLISQQYFKKHGNHAESQIIKKADAVAANSKYLKNYAAKYNDNAVDVGQGCDVESFLQIPSTLPEDVKQIPWPVIGYCGSLTATRLDIELIYFIGKNKPGWNIVLVGPQDEAFKNSILHSLPNIYFLGTKPEKDLPGYIHSFDVCINPQLLNQMTVGNYPRKVDEYLAAGKPVVATKTETMEMFLPLVYLCVSNQDYLNNITLALAEDNNDFIAQQRKQMGKSHTWEASVKKIYSLINN
ncbi:MAG: glycosyltransferase [Ferruginibacter sp.]